MHTPSIVTAAFVGLAAAGTVPRAADSTHRAVRHSNNWCGKVNYYKDITEIEATWTVPAVTIPAGGSYGPKWQTYSWIGTGGSKPCGSDKDLLQAGTASFVENGVPEYHLYYQMYPSTHAQRVHDFAVTAGDEIYCKVTKDSSTKGTFFWINNTTGQNTTATLRTNRGRTICSETAEWIHERPSKDGAPTAFPDWSEFSFTGCSASASDGTSLNLRGSTSEDLYLTSGGSRDCHGDATSDSTLNIVHG